MVKQLTYSIGCACGRAAAGASLLAFTAKSRVPMAAAKQMSHQKGIRTGVRLRISSTIRMGVIATEARRSEVS